MHGTRLPEAATSPRVASLLGSGGSQILQVAELAPKKIKINCCFSCFKIGGFSNLGRCHEQAYRYSATHGYHRHEYINCENSTKTAELCELDPKSPGAKSGNSEAYVSQAAHSFIVTDDLRVGPLSLDSSLRVSQ